MLADFSITTMLLHYRLQFECFFDVRSYICDRVNFFQECDHVQQFFVVSLAYERLDWHSVCEIEGKWYDRIIHDYQFFQVSVFNDGEVFDEYTLGWFYTMMSIKSMFDDCPVNVNEIENCISVILFTCSENTDFIHVRQVS